MEVWLRLAKTRLSPWYAVTPFAYVINLDYCFYKCPRHLTCKYPWQIHVLQVHLRRRVKAVAMHTHFQVSGTEAWHTWILLISIVEFWKTLERILFVSWNEKLIQASCCIHTPCGQSQVWVQSVCPVETRWTLTDKCIYITDAFFAQHKPTEALMSHAAWGSLSPFSHFQIFFFLGVWTFQHFL